MMVEGEEWANPGGTGVMNYSNPSLKLNMASSTADDYEIMALDLHVESAQFCSGAPDVRGHFIILSPPTPFSFSQPFLTSFTFLSYRIILF